MNNRPTAANNTVTTAEDTAYTFDATDFGFMDVDTDDALDSVKIVTLPALGSLANNSVAVNRNQSVSKADLDDDKLVFTPAANANGDPYTNFTFTVNDGDADSAEVYTLTIDVTAANDPPTAANNTVTTAEDTAYTFDATDFGFMDVDTDDALDSVRIVTLPALGSLANDGVAVTRNQSVSKADLDDDKLVFTPAANTNGDPYTSFTFTVNDGDADSAASYTMTIDVTAAKIPREQPIDPLEPANADVDWKAKVTVGHWHVRNREWERGWRVQACAQRTDFTEVEDIEDHDPSDICFGRISDRDFTVGTETYTLEGIFHSVAHKNDSLTLAFTQEVDLAPLLNRTFVINGQSYAVTDRYYPQGNASRGPQIVWAEPTWTTAGGWTVGSAVWIGLESTSISNSKSRTAPVVVGSPTVSAAGSDDVWAEGETVEVTIIFNEAVVVDTTGGSPSLGLSLGGTVVRTAAYLRGSGTTALVFGYTLAKADGSHTSLLVTGDSLALNGGTIRSQATGTDAILSHKGATVLARPVMPNTRGTDRSQDKRRRYTARFAAMPETNDGVTAFSFELHFSEEPDGMNWETVAGALLAVSGANVTKARRLNPPANQGWEVHVTPTHDGDVVITLPARACGEANAVCFGNGTTPLSEAATTTVPAVPFEGSFAQAPHEHDGATPFELNFHLSAAPASLGWETVRDALFEVTGGSVEHAYRLVKGSDLGWTVRVAPTDAGAVTVTLKDTTDCNTLPRVCTASGRKLAGGLRAVIHGPASLSVADAAVDENAATPAWRSW